MSTIVALRRPLAGSSLRFSAAVFLVVTASCMGAVDREGSQEPGSNAPAPPVAALSEPNIRQMVSPIHPDGQPWRLIDGSSAAGSGPCASTALSSVLDGIRAQFQEVSGILSFRPSGPRGVVMTAGPPVPLTESPPPASGDSEYVTAFVDDRSFGIVFVRGARCRSDVCEDREHWYFETGDACRPRWVGHLLVSDRVGGRFGHCLDVVGWSVWQFPANPDARQRCDADWSAQDISGTRRAWSLDPVGSCATNQQEGIGIVPVEVSFSQGPDLAAAAVVIRGTDIPFVDGRSFVGKVERRRFSATVQERLPGPCDIQRRLRFTFDFEGGSINGLPGGFGIVDIGQEAGGACAGIATGCGASLHFMPRD